MRNTVKLSEITINDAIEPNARRAAFARNLMIEYYGARLLFAHSIRRSDIDHMKETLIKLIPSMPFVLSSSKDFFRAFLYTCEHPSGSSAGAINGK